MSKSMSQFRVGAIAVLLVLGVAACGDDSGPSQSQGAVVNHLAEEMASEGGLALERDEADCLAQALVDELGHARLAEALDDAGGTFAAIDDAELAEELGPAMYAAMMVCSDVDGMVVPPG